MLHEKINLGNSGYGTRDTILTTYVQNNLEGVHARRRPAVIICPGGGYEYQSDRESEPIALEFLKRGYQAFILEYAVLEENETKGGCICEGTSGGMECGRRADYDPGMFGRRKSVCALQRILSAGLVYKKDRIQPETNAGTSHDLVLSRDRLQGRMAERG